MENKKSKKTFFDRFYPTYVYPDVESIPYSLILGQNIKLILFDMDNTLVDNNYKYSEELKKWTEYIASQGVKLHILSNSTMGKKVKKIAKDLGMKYHYNASKPLKKGFKKVIEEMNVNKDEVLMIGDQLFTDVWGGNRFGIKTLLVCPIAEKEIFVARVKRPLERWILKKYYKREMEKDN